MSRIKSRGTSIEKHFRSALRKHKIRFRGNVKRVFGKPDFVIYKKKIAIFCDSAFWHGYRNGTTKRHNFHSNRAFWRHKIKGNIIRDKMVNQTLRSAGWEVLRFWDRDIENSIDECIDKIKESIHS